MPMPELPEVEIMRRNVERWAVGQRVTRLDCLRPTTFRDGSLEAAQRLPGARVEQVLRRGKVMWIEVSRGHGWLVRFGMTGKWLHVAPAHDELPPHVRAVLALEDGTRLVFADCRNLGSIRVYHGVSGEYLLQQVVPGIDPLLDGLSGRNLAACTAGRRSPIKALLLDQAAIAGIGNIYASEVLFAAGIHPRRPGRTLSPTECARLAGQIQRVLTWAIDFFAADDIRLQGEEGVGDPFQVYRRHGLPCRRCRTPIERERIASRSTFYCPRCQPLRAAIDPEDSACQ